MPNVLFLSYDGLTDNLGQSQIVPYMNRLASLGHDITIISVDKPHLLLDRQSIVNNSLHAGINWITVPYTKNPPLLSTILDLRRMAKAVWQVQANKDIDIVHVRSYPPMSLALKFSKKTKAKVLFDMRGFYPDERVEGGIWRRTNPMHMMAYNHIKKQEAINFKTSDHIISLTHNGKSLIANRHEVSPDKITVIPCCADFEHFDFPKDVRRVESNSLNIVYLGSLGTWYLTNEMLRLFKRIRELYPGSIFHILTHDAPDESLEYAKTIGLETSSLRFEPAERGKLPEVLSHMDLSIFFIKESFSKRASSPTKLAELLACGIPVICNPDVGDIRAIGEAQPGVQTIELQELDTANLGPTIDRLIKIPKSTIRSEAQKRFSLEVAIDNYSKAYNRLSS